MDSVIFNFLYDTFADKGRLSDTLIFLFAEVLPYFFAAVIFAWVFWKKRGRIALIWLAVAGAVVSRFGIAVLIRFLWDRSRPFEVLNIIPLFSHDIGHAFPSGHAAFFFALVPPIFFLSRKAGWMFLTTAVLMAVSRVIAGVHWPSDVLAGAIMGLFVGHLTSIVYLYRHTKTTKE